MTETKFTPGPWDTKGIHRKPTDFNVFAPSGRSICSTGGYQDGKEKTFFENQANAHLIAAAPELYQALALARSLIAGSLIGRDWVNTSETFLEQADAVLAKARGET